jgi:hypothetical protein
VMPKSRAAGDIADDSTDSSLAPTAQSDSEGTDPTETSIAHPASSEPNLTANDAEAIVGGVYHDDARIWGNQLTWNQLNPARVKAHSIYSCGFGESSDVDLSTHPLGASYQDRATVEKAYQDSARKLDEVANDLEVAKLFHDADELREIIARIRSRARMLPPEQAVFYISGVGFSR